MTHATAPRILITGASGTIGRATARLLAGAGHAVRLLGRDPARLPDLGPLGEPVTGDFADPAGLRAALAGIEKVLVITRDPRLPEYDANIVDAARAAGVRHLVKLSALAVTDDGAEDFLTRWQRAAEERVRACGLDWTMLRPRSFMSNTLSWADGVRSAGLVRAWPADAPNACVDPRDVAAVAALVLTGDGHAGQAYALTGPEALTARQQTAALGAALGRELAFQELTGDQVYAATERRYGPQVAAALRESGERQLRGAKGHVEPAVERLLGRPARSYGTWARDHAGLFR
ncbi:NAD(P)H-binding protein [Streptomyces sp. NPDC049577]|uniref:NAD(P)H-binding protein n=1 Tax=Streptomyces sp. NPDC049577 TaxID=3155153 RepID=UPI00343B044F